MKFPRDIALKAASELCKALDPACEKLVVAGSLRRRKAEVGDVEILYIPRIDIEAVPTGDMFEPTRSISLNRADAVINAMLAEGRLSKRQNVNGSVMWGAKNKFAMHVATGVPVDLFSTTQEAWFNYLVCRTGGSENNVRICEEAQKRGLKWNPYGAGFTRLSDDTLIPVASERDVFETVGLPYLQPHER